MSARLSVVVATYNRERVLRETLARLASQLGPDDELIVVDQSPRHEPETDAFLARLPETCRARTIVRRLERPNLPAARNEGVRLASAGVVVFLDDDIVPMPGLLEAHLVNYADPQVVAVAGRILPPERAAEAAAGATSPRSAPAGRAPRVPAALGSLVARYDSPAPADVETVCGCNMSFRRTAVVKSGGFDEAFAGNGFREESDLCARLRARGRRIVYDPSATVIHLPMDSGGCENHLMFGRSAASQRYYDAFFRNNAYFFLKNVPRRHGPWFLWYLYRRHVLNRVSLFGGPRFFLRRHLALLKGLTGALALYRAARRRGSRP